MAITATGSASNFYDTFNLNAGSTSISIPADAEILIVGVVGFITGVSPFSGGTLTIGGAAMTYVTGGDADTGKMSGGQFYKVLPATGTQTLAWDWTGASAMEGGTLFTWRSYKGINTSGAIRDTDATQQASSPHTSGTLTAQSGDMIVAYSWQYVPGSDATFSWTGATEAIGYANGSGHEVDDSLAEASPTGNQTVSTSVSSSSDGGISAIVLIASGGSSPGAGSDTDVVQVTESSANLIRVNIVEETS